MRNLTADEAAKMPVQERCQRLLDEFDEWLGVRRIQYGLKYGDLPQLNDAFRGYFADTRTLQKLETCRAADEAPRELEHRLNMTK